ncbi:MAG: archease [Candidatus Thermoplasmatota archaeon]|jgi:SHS2 domain-containing protein|nr:archease [Candidatus Thermoplasmatota archaeon]MCL5963928.1 archease [Candidatus Thermoplasmatota archaeon]
MCSYRVFGTTADVGVEAHAETLSDLFSTMGSGLYSIFTDVERVRCIERRNMFIESENLIDGMIDYLNEMIYLTDSQQILFSKFDVDVKTDKGVNITGNICGEYIKKHHHLKVPVKAATYHNAIIKHNGEWTARIIFDI